MSWFHGRPVVVLLAAVAHLYYLTLKKSGPATPAIVAPASAQYGSRIAFVESDTLEEKYEWLKQQREALEKRLTSLSSTFENKMRAHQEKSMGRLAGCAGKNLLGFGKFGKGLQILRSQHFLENRFRACVVSQV